MYNNFMNPNNSDINIFGFNGKNNEVLEKVNENIFGDDEII